MRAIAGEAAIIHPQEKSVYFLKSKLLLTPDNAVAGNTGQDPIKRLGE
jgi:hypothetical protein